MGGRRDGTLNFRFSSSTSHFLGIQHTSPVLLHVSAGREGQVQDLINSDFAKQTERFV